MAWEFTISFGKKENGNKVVEVVQEAPPETIQVPEVITDPPAPNYDKAVFDAFKKEEEYYAKNPATDDQTRPIIRPGRTSVYEGNRNFIPSQNSPVVSDFPFDHLEFLQKLGMWNRHISYATDNITTLGNTEYELTFGDDVPDEMAAEMRKHIRTVVKSWYEFSEGENSLDNDLLAQLATTGALSAEAVIKKDLSGIKKIVRVNPTNIRFAYDPKADEHIPLQKADSIISGKNSKRKKGNYPGYIELNKVTYSYLAMRRFNEIPYAIPPFIAAIEDILIENDMTKNFANIMRRLGMLGFLSVLVKAPTVKVGESETGYNTRMVNYLEALRPGVEGGFHKGVTMGFKDSHEFKMQGSNVNAQAGDNLLKMVKSLIFAGLKQDPNMHGENYSTTETFGRVILTKMTQQVANYQKSLAEFKGRIFKLELLLVGFPVSLVEVKYKPALISDKKHEAETETIEIDNANALYANGTIDQQQRAEKLGYDEPAEPGPRETVADKVAIAGIDQHADESIKPPMAVSASKIINDIDILGFRHKFGGMAPVFNYQVPDQCKPSDGQYAKFKEPEMQAFVNGYVSDINTRFNSAIEKSKPGMVENLMSLQVENPSDGLIRSILFYGLYNQWDSNFIAPAQDDIADNIEKIYRFYRQDKKPFNDGIANAKLAAVASGNGSVQLVKEKIALFTVPDPVFELLDARAIEFLESLDSIWLGKFITDPDTVLRMTRWINEAVLSQGMGIGRNSQATRAFVNRFGEMVKLENYKIRRIIDTTANRTRNMGNVMYMNQAGVVNYEVVEVGDTQTCPWCLHMHGTVFKIAPTVNKIEKLSNSSFSNLPEISPFATQVPIDQFQQMDAITLQSQGYDVPSYHPHCRGRVVADL